MQGLQKARRAESVLQNICYRWNAETAERAVLSNTVFFFLLCVGSSPILTLQRSFAQHCKQQLAQTGKHPLFSRLGLCHFLCFLPKLTPSK